MSRLLVPVIYIVGVGVVGTTLSKEGALFKVSDFFSGSLKWATKFLKEDKNSSGSSGKSKADSLLAQVNNLRQELQLLSSSRSITIITGSKSGSRTYGVTTIIVVAVVGCGYAWWKGWSPSGLMFVTRRCFSDAGAAVGKQIDQLSSSILSTRRDLSSNIDRVDIKVDECKALTDDTKGEVSALHGELSGFHVQFESVHREVRNIGTKLERIEGSQDFATRGVYHLCQVVAKGLEESRKEQLIQDFATRGVYHLCQVAKGLGESRKEQLIQKSLNISTSPLALESPESTPISRDGTPQTDSLLSLPLEPPLPSPSNAIPRVLRPTISISTAGLKELADASSVVQATSRLEAWPRPSSMDIPPRTPPTQEQSKSALSQFGLKLSGFLTRSRSDAS